MLFTRGKNRYYEKMMQEVPGFHKDKFHNNRSDSRFKYKYTDLDCACCNEYKRCNHALCPHIMENLADLCADENFLLAVETAESCKTAQKNTLLMLKNQLVGSTV